MGNFRGFYDHGGNGQTILLVHGLMGNGQTWFDHVYWLKQYGRIFTFDAAYHQGKKDAFLEIEDIETERFVADIAELLYWIDRGPAVLIGHSMGGLHSWCTASMYPELVSALIVEDMVPEFPHQSVDSWISYFHSWPQRFSSVEHAITFLGPTAGKYFWTAFENGSPHGHMNTWLQIAALWGTRNFWDQWNDVHQPTLLIQGERGIDYFGLMTKMAKNPAVISHVIVPDAGHLIHDEKTAYYRGAVEAFLAGLPYVDYN